MRAFVLDTGRLIEPFGEPPGHALFALGTVFDAVRASLERRGCEVVKVALGEEVPALGEACVVLADHCYVSDKALGDFLALCFGEPELARLALCKTPSSDYTRPVSSVATEPLDVSGPGARPVKGGRTDQAASERLAYDCYYVPPGKLPSSSPSDLLAALRTDASRRVVPKRELVREVRMPIVGDAEHNKLLFPITSTVACHVEHWVHILWLNHLAFGIAWMELLRQHKAWALWRALAAFPYGLPRMLSSFVWRGKDAHIHPTAHVEASILGDGVRIGPRASVRNSVLGAGVEVGDHATVLTSVLGAGAYVTPKSFFVWGAAYPEAVISNYKMQMSLLGRRASSSTWAGLIDAKFQGAIEVLHDDERRSTERSFLGSCLGHHAHIGAKVLVLPGRSIPNGTFITMRPEELVREVPADLTPGVAMVRHEGTLVPLERLLQRAPPASSPVDA
jgi:acetyltransferase-like isoleucine patch superfamily enzyme